MNYHACSRWCHRRFIKIIWSKKVGICWESWVQPGILKEVKGDCAFERLDSPIRWLGNLDLSSRIQTWSGFFKFWFFVPLHFVCACVVEPVGSLSHMFHSFFQVTRTLVVHNVSFHFDTSYFEDLVDLEERIAYGLCLPAFDWFSQDCIAIIFIHDHNIQISPAWLLW